MQTVEWEKKFANHVSDKGYYTECIKYACNSTTTIKTNNLIRKWKRIDISPKHDIQMVVNKHTKRCSTSLTIREMQIKTTMTDQSTSTKMASVETKQTENNKCW